MAQVAERPEFQHILEELAAYSQERLYQFKLAFDRATQKKLDKKHFSERDLIRLIRTGGLHSIDQERMEQLFRVKFERPLTDAEHEELGELVEQQTVWSNERSELLLELGRRWRMNTTAVLKKLEINPSRNIYG